MLVLFETAAGFALFKVLDSGILKRPETLGQAFADSEQAKQTVALQTFVKFDNITDAMSSATALVESKMSKQLKKFLKKAIVSAGITDQLAVADPKLGNNIKSKLGIACVHDSAVINELFRGIRQQLEHLVEGLEGGDLKNMALGLSHSMSRYKLKFSPDKVDTMIVQAISLLDDLDKELNTYSMRAREWYGWHFPELSKLVPDNLAYARLVRRVGMRQGVTREVVAEVVAEEVAGEVVEAAHISMGTEISAEDVENILELCGQVIAISEYRAQLFEYLRNRMQAIAPNLTVLVGEVVGARLIAHAGSLISLAKYPASTVQILGAEKALFRALKTKHETPKYGLIYHASLIGQTGPKNKGKVSRLLAAKASLSARVDALGDRDAPLVGLELRAKVEQRIRTLEGRPATAPTPSSGTPATPAKYDSKRGPHFSPAVDAPGTTTKRPRAEEAPAGAHTKRSKNEGKQAKRRPPEEDGAEEEEEEEDGGRENGDQEQQQQQQQQEGEEEEEAPPATGEHNDEEDTQGKKERKEKKGKKEQKEKKQKKQKKEKSTRD